MNVLDLFCGAGGMSYGFKLAGYNIVGGVEWDKAASETHKKNLKSKIDFCGDIREISDDFILENFSDVDVIIGGPPCQGFSSANRTQKELDDPRNKLFFEYLRFVKLIKPKAFVIENVKEILTKDKGYAKNRILELMGEIGYNISVKVLSADEYGVPQRRKRAFFVGIRNENGECFDFEKMKKCDNVVTVFDAIGDICYPELGVMNDFLKYAKDSGDVLENHAVRMPNEKVQERIAHVPQGGNWKDVPKELWETQRDNRFSSSYRRLNFKDVSITIETGHMNYFHPIDNRVPTVRESARLQSFPDSFVFVGNSREQFKQVGNAVPPLLAKAIGEALKGYI